jgi:hypothetical protein
LDYKNLARYSRLRIIYSYSLAEADGRNDDRIKRNQLRHSRSEANDGFERVPFFTVLRSLINLIKAIKLRQFLEREAPLRVEFDELRDKNVG